MSSERKAKARLINNQNPEGFLLWIEQNGAQQGSLGTDVLPIGSSRVWYHPFRGTKLGVKSSGFRFGFSRGPPL